MEKTRWQQIEALYHAALERPPNERSRFLSDESSGDAELCNEVQSLLSSNEEGGSFLAEPEFSLGLEILNRPVLVLKQGQEFGHYSILDLLGRGGMGEVYLAEDTKLRRRIALKVLPAEVASDRDRISRFIQEARAASALNHPNILTIHEIGEADGWRFIASEFVEGQTLRERIRGEESLSLHDSIEIVLQIAAALNAAHRAGIVHRDIKPENIMLREDGLVKVLDFGLAKLIDSPDRQNSAASFASTSPGMVMGTIAYMSPEQTRGKKTDARSDIWSLGVVLYEMLTGRLPFGGDTSSDMIAAILTIEPALPENETWMPESLWRIITKSLRKNPDERFQTVNDMANDLRAVFSDADTVPSGAFRKPTNFTLIGGTDPAFVQTGEGSRRSQAERTGSRWSGYKVGLAGAFVLALVLAGGFVGYSVLKSSSWLARQPMTITRIFDAGKTISAAVSPDGKYIAHALSEEGKQSLWIKHIATNSNVQLIAPEKVGYTIVGFSKDGGYIYFLNGSGLSQIAVLGGDPKRIYSEIGHSVSFSPDERQFAFFKDLSKDENALMIANVDGDGEERQLAPQKAPLSFTGTPAWSPDGKHIACAVFTGEGKRAHIMLYPVAGGEARPFSDQTWRGVDELMWLPDGSGLLAMAGPEAGPGLAQIWLLPTSGETPRLVTNDLNSYTQMSVTADSKQLLAIQWENRVNMWYLPGGKTEEAKLLSNNVHSQFRYVALTPDGRIVFPSAGDADGTRDIWIMNRDGTGAKRLTNTGNNITPCATSDGKYILFSSNRGDSKTYHIWRINVDGSDPVQLTNGPRGERAPACSSDPETVVYATGGPDAGMEGSNIWKISINGGEPTQLTDYPSLAPDVSPDGKYVSMRLQPDPGGPIKLGIIPISGGQPIKVFDAKHAAPIRWRPDGRSITYVRYDDAVANIWEQPLDGSPARPITKFTGETIQGFAWTKNGDLICVRGFEARDPVLFSNFK